MKYSVNVKTAPTAEPLTLTETKLHLRVDSDITDQDTLISALITAAREWAENFTRRSFVQRTLELRLDGFPGQLLLPRGPVVSVTSVKYTAQDGTLTTVAASLYQTDLYSVPARILPVFGAIWPVPGFGTLNAVVVEYEAGYAHTSGSPTDMADAVPSAIKAAMKLMIGNWYENREAVSMANVMPQEVPLAVKHLLAPFVIRDYALE